MIKVLSYIGEMTLKEGQATMFVINPETYEHERDQLLTNSLLTAVQVAKCKQIEKCYKNLYPSAK